MMKFKRLAVAAAIAGCSFSASAVTITDLGPLNISPETNVFSGFAPVGFFTDVFTFELPANGGSGYGVVNFPIDAGAAGNFDLFFSHLTLVSNPDGILNNGDDAVVKTASGVGDTSKSLSFTLPGNTGGNMYLVVAGGTTGTLGGVYSGGINVSPVPEPEAWAMMLVGAGLVGFRLRNRSKKAAANRFV